MIQWWYYKKKLDASHSWGLKDQYHPKRKFSLCYPQTGWADDIFYISKKKKKTFHMFLVTVRLDHTMAIRKHKTQFTEWWQKFCLQLSP